MIGIFDSGIGGLTVTKEVVASSDYQLLYLGDTARTPYGNRSQDLIYQFTVQAVDYLFKHGCQLIIIACNTASAEALRKIQQEWLPKNFPDRRVLGVIRPVVEVAAVESITGRIGVVGTRATVNSGAYDRELKQQKSSLKIFSQACPIVVPLVEEGLQNRPETMKFIRNCLRPLKAKKIDTLILGCTHYPLLFKKFKQAAGKSIKVLDTGKIVADKLTEYLVKHPEIETKLTKGKGHRFLVTDVTATFKENAQKWLGQDIKLEKIDLQ
ncbi:MAG: glutamate racemase [Parcubacteria group bacterium]|jgi:glutamate racemase|nr:glutamate racemase [Parcubacteria group bacterium]|tara:strand:+ start:4540 stop:5343 length:804 start_codon:yes stop_codon:yes gene_type:complete